MSTSMLTHKQNSILAASSYMITDVTSSAGPSLSKMSAEIQLIIYNFVFGPWRAVFAPLPPVARPSEIDFMDYVYATGMYRWYTDDSPENTSFRTHYKDNEKRNSIIHTCKDIAAIAIEAREKAFTGRLTSMICAEKLEDDENFKDCLASPKYAKMLSKIQTVSFTHSYGKLIPRSALGNMVELFSQLRRIDIDITYKFRYVNALAAYDTDSDQDMTTMEGEMIQLLRHFNFHPWWFPSQRLADRKPANTREIEVYLHINVLWTCSCTGETPVWSKLVLLARRALGGTAFIRQFSGPPNRSKGRDFRLIQ